MHYGQTSEIFTFLWPDKRQHILKDQFVETASEVNLKELLLTFGSFVGSRKRDVCWGDKQNSPLNHLQIFYQDPRMLLILKI